MILHDREDLEAYSSCGAVTFAVASRAGYSPGSESDSQEDREPPDQPGMLSEISPFKSINNTSQTTMIAKTFFLM
jgi:hypothetical protein